MNGKIINFDDYKNTGIIIADDGVQYSFDGKDWIERYAPKAGDNVDFMFNGTGSINRISYQSSQSQASTPPSLLKEPQSQNISTTPELKDYDRPENSQHDENIGSLYLEESNYGIVDWTKKVFSNYATFTGRARRKEYWLFYLATILLSLVFGFMEGFFGALLGIGTGDEAISPLILALVFFIPTIAVATRRLHDTGRSGWWQLLWFIPIIGWIVLVVFLVQQTSPQNNQWGLPAKRV